MTEEELKLIEHVKELKLIEHVFDSLMIVIVIGIVCYFIYKMYKES